MPVEPSNWHAFLFVLGCLLTTLTFAFCTVGKPALAALNKLLADQHDRKMKGITQTPSAWHFHCGNCNISRVEFRHPQQMKQMTGKVLAGTVSDWRLTPICDECIDALSKEKLSEREHVFLPNSDRRDG